MNKTELSTDINQKIVNIYFAQIHKAKCECVLKQNTKLKTTCRVKNVIMKLWPCKYSVYKYIYCTTHTGYASPL